MSFVLPVCLLDVLLPPNQRLQEGCPRQGSSKFPGPLPKQLVTESLPLLDLVPESEVDLAHFVGDHCIGFETNSWKSESVPFSLENLHQVICRAIRGGAKRLELARSPLKDQSGNSTPCSMGLVSFTFGEPQFPSNCQTNSSATVENSPLSNAG